MKCIGIIQGISLNFNLTDNIDELIMKRRNPIKLISELFDFDGENSKFIFVILSLDKVKFSDIVNIIGNIDDAIEIVLSMYWWRMLIPVSSNSLAWNINSPKLFWNEVYERPLCIKYAFEYLINNGEWDYKYAIKRYLKTIGEKSVESIIKIIDLILKHRVFKFYVTANIIGEALRQIGLSINDFGKIIAELKFGGIISPVISIPLIKIIGNGPIYELNKALFIKQLSIL